VLPPLAALAPALRRTLGGLPRAYWALWAGILVNRIGGFVVPFLALYLTQRRGMSVARAGALVSLYGLGAVGAGPVAGLVADRVGRRAALLGSLAGGAAFTAAIPFVRGAGPLAALVLAAGFVGEMYRPAAHAVVGDLVPREDRVRAFGVLYWGVNLGVAIGLVLAGALADVSFTLLFLGDAATSLAFALVVWRLVPETRPEAPPEGIRQALGGLVAPLRDGAFAPFLVLHLLLAVVFFQFQLGLPVDMASHGVSPGRFGALMALNGVVIVVLQPLVAGRIGRVDGSRAMAAGTALIGLGFGMNGVHHGVGWYALAIVVWTLGEIAYLPVASTLPADLAPPALRGRYQGAYSLSWALAFTVAPALGAAVLDRWGPGTLWAGALVLGLAVSAGLLATAPARRRRIAGFRAHGAGHGTDGPGPPGPPDPPRGG
jgi:MFS family permease